jgi:hypothetical protein
MVYLFLRLRPPSSEAPPFALIRCEPPEVGRLCPEAVLVPVCDFLAATLLDNGRANDRANKGRSFYRDHIRKRAEVKQRLGAFTYRVRVHRGRSTYCMPLDRLEELALLFERKLRPGTSAAAAEAAARFRAGDRAVFVERSTRYEVDHSAAQGGAMSSVI